jgi:hypothetical protein
LTFGDAAATIATKWRLLKQLLYRPKQKNGQHMQMKPDTNERK